jgi:hypothetical protein
LIGISHAGFRSSCKVSVTRMADRGHWRLRIAGIPQRNFKRSNWRSTQDFVRLEPTVPGVHDGDNTYIANTKVRCPGLTCRSKACVVIENREQRHTQPV